MSQPNPLSIWYQIKTAKPEAIVGGMIRYRPIVQNREVKMVVDESGDWTSLTCYYTLHDRVVRLQAEVDRLRKGQQA